MNIKPCRKCGKPGKVYKWQLWSEKKLVRVDGPFVQCENKCSKCVGQTVEQAVSYWNKEQERGE